MKRNSIMVVLFAATTLIGTTALAGYHWGSEVVIDTSLRKALGTMANVRASNDNVQNIGCAVRASTGSSAGVNCYATDSTGQSIQCFSSEAGFVQAAGSITSNSHLIFQWNAQGTCTYISVENYSSNAPVEP
jgi:hypothetical protein